MFCYRHTQAVSSTASRFQIFPDVLELTSEFQEKMYDQAAIFTFFCKFQVEGGRNNLPLADIAVFAKTAILANTF
jgi:hypothetical protein